MMSKSASFGGYCCAVSETLGTDAVSETALRYVTGWGSTTVDFGVNYGGNIG